MTDAEAIDAAITFGGEWRPHPTKPDQWVFWRRNGLNGRLIETPRAFHGTPRMQRMPACPKT